MPLAFRAYTRLCVRVCMHIAVLLHKSFRGLCILSLARKTEENKHCLYYNNEYALGSK